MSCIQLVNSDLFRLLENFKFLFPCSDFFLYKRTSVTSIFLSHAGNRICVATKKQLSVTINKIVVLQLGIRQKEYNPTVQEAWDDLAGRVALLFANEVLSFGAYELWL